MKRALASLVFVAFTIIGPAFALAQSELKTSPEIIITWQAPQSYSPGFFRGKTLAAKESKILADLLVIENAKIVDLSNVEVRWFLNGRLINSGLGLDEIEFFLDPLSLRHNDLSVTLRQYKGEDFSKSINIPQSPPTLVFEELSLNNIQNKAAIELVIHPFFFNIQSIDELSFTWNINKEVFESFGLTGSKFPVNLSPLNSGDLLNLSVEAKKISDPLERSAFSAKYTIQ